jgi:undecaprenyl pyrophosphate phosphatase UppP
VFATLVAPSLIFSALYPALLGAMMAIGPHATSPLVLDVVPRLAVAFITAFVSGYVALVLAKTYADISYGRRLR